MPHHPFPLPQDTMRYALPVSLLLAGVAAAQGSDTCSTPLTVTGAGPHAFDTTGATTDGQPDLLCDFFGNQDIFDDVWFEWTAQDNAEHVISLCGSTGDTKAAVYTDGCAGLILACNDDACGLISELTFTAVAGQTYDIRVGNYAAGGAAFGSFTVTPYVLTQNPANGHFYLVVNANISWIDARTEAETSLLQGTPGHLVTITDQAELDWILNNLTLQRPWIGLFQNTASPSYSEPGGGWEWVTGEPMTFLPWSPGEPNNNSASGGAEDYAEMFVNGKWNDAELNHAVTTQYIIEWESGTIGTTYCTSNPNSTGVNSSLSAAGSVEVSSNDLTLTAADLPPSSFGFFLASQTQGAVANPGGSEGVLCLGGAIGRFVGPGQIKNSGSNGEFSLALDLTALPSPTGFVTAMPGETWNFQAWHRDAVGGSAVSNFTDGLSTTLQ